MILVSMGHTWMDGWPVLVSMRCPSKEGLLAKKEGQETDEAGGPKKFTKLQLITEYTPVN